MPPKKAASSSSSSALPFVSVLTPTYNRRKFIEAAIRCFRNQSYPQDRMEWIVLDDGTDKVKDLFDAANAKGPANIKYYSLDEKLPIGAKRNRINELATGDICVCWDDDDYYPPDRVKKAVTKLRSSPGYKVPVVGSSQLYLYFTDRDEIWSIGPYNQNHCTNGTMAYWRSYFKDHRYDDLAEKAEEAKFMDNWKTPVFQLTPEDTMLVLCHAHNTFDKRVLLNQKNPSMKKVAVKMRQLVKDKFLCNFYLDLARDYKEKDEAAAAAIPLSESLIDPFAPQLVVSDISDQGLSNNALPTFSASPTASPV
jgi:glycosyltransferase involved in cell wall biosynthesis